MIHNDLSLTAMKKEWHGSLKAYLLGFIASLILTTTSFGLVISEVLTGSYLVHTLAGLALIQAAFQLIFFLHLGQEASPRWETVTFCLMFLILAILAVGSLWIMNDLDDRMMSFQTTESTRVHRG